MAGKTWRSFFIKPTSGENDGGSFFRKSFYRIYSPLFHYLIWLSVNAAPRLQSVYSLLFTPDMADDFVLVVKETRSGIGLMNLVTVPLGGIPMCHGSGGLAAQYKFGARTGGSVIMLGVIKVFIGIVFGGALIGLLRVYPMAVLGPMLVFAGVELARASREVIEETHGLVIALVTAACVIGLNTWVGFLAGSLICFAISIQSRRKGS